MVRSMQEGKTRLERKRIAVIGFLHESNTFISTPTDCKDVLFKE